MHTREREYPESHQAEKQNTFFLSRVQQFISPRENSYVVHLFSLNENRFLMQDNRFECLPEDSRERLAVEGWGYWYSLIHEKYSDLAKNCIDKFLLPPFYRKKIRLTYPMYRAGGWIGVQHDLSLHHCNSLWFVLSLVVGLPKSHWINTSAHRLDSDRNPVSKEDCQQDPDISEREIEVLTHISDGLSSKETAEKLFISPHTVISHRKNLMQKFMVKNTAQLIKKAFATYEL